MGKGGLTSPNMGIPVKLQISRHYLNGILDCSFAAGLWGHSIQFIHLRTQVESQAFHPICVQRAAPRRVRLWWLEEEEVEEEEEKG